MQVNQAAKGINSNHDALADLLESIEHCLERVNIYTRIPPTPAMNEAVSKIIVELLTTLALATKNFECGRSSESVLAYSGAALFSAMQSNLLRKER
jgi:hypothetical protein